MGNRVRITVLVDNAESPGLYSEWGLSLLVQRGAWQVIVDFGKSDAFAKNAERLGIDLAQVDVATLSHAHYDHADGMEAFFCRNDHAPLYLSTACAENCWSAAGGATEPHYIGIGEGLLARFAARLRPLPTGEVSPIAPGVYVIPHATPGLERKGRSDGMLLHNANAWRPDDFAHEVSLAVELGEGADAPLAIVSSCSHAGPAVIVREVAAALPGKQIRAYVGGLHLFRSPDADVIRIAREMSDKGVQDLYVGHCTGEHAIELLRSEFGGNVVALRPGLVFEP